MEARRLDLLGLLIQPVQRIPRYQMLLEVRHPPTHPAHPNAFALTWLCDYGRTCEGGHQKTTPTTRT